METETGAKGSGIASPFTDGQNVLRGNVQDGGSKGAALFPHGTTGAAEQGTRREGGPLQGFAVGPGGGSFEELPRGVVHDPVFRLGGPAVGPGGGDANQVEGPDFVARRQTVMLGVEDTRGGGRDEANEGLAGGGETDQRAALSVAGERRDQKFERHYADSGLQ